MTPSVFFLLFCFSPIYGLLIYRAVILGDAAKFTFGENCKGNISWIVRQPDDRTRPVGARQQGVFAPAAGYENRIKAETDEEVSLVFDRTTFNDKGVYECRCDGRQLPDDVRLDILVPYEVSVVEGQDVTLPCYSGTAATGTSRVIKWERDGKLVLETDVVSGNVSYGPGFEGRVSVSPDGFREGVLSLILNGTQREDQGGFFCYHGRDEEEERGNPSAVRLTVTEKPIVASVDIPVEAFAATVTIVIFALLVVLIVWGLKYRRLLAKVPSSTGGAAARGPGNVPISTLSSGHENDPLNPPAVNGSAAGSHMVTEEES